MLTRFPRILRLVVGGAAILLLVASFARVVSRPFRAKKLTAGQVEITVLHWGEKTEDKIVSDLVADFERLPENRDIRIRRINPGQAATLNTKLQTMFAAGEPPDVFYLDYAKVADFAEKDILLDLDPLIEADKAAGVSGVNLDDFFPSVVRSFRFNPKTGLIGSGKLVGLPKDFTTVGFYYNRDLFRRAGVPEPAVSGWTWDEFHTAARKIAALPGCYGADFVTWEAMIRLFLWTHDLDFGSEHWQKLHFDDPRVQQVLEKLRGWFHNERRTLVSAKTQLETGLEPFMAGNVGMTGPLGRWKAPTYRLITGFDWDFAPLPHAQGCPPRNGVFTVGWAIARQSPHRSQAWRFIRYLETRRGQEQMCTAGLAIPVLKSVAYGPLFSDPSQKPRNVRAYLDAAANAEPIAWPADPRYQDSLRVRLEEIFKLGQPVAPALARVQQSWLELRRKATLDHLYPRLNWSRAATLFIVPSAVAIVAVVVLWWKRRPRGMELRDEIAGYAGISPWAIGFAAFTAFPIVLSLILSFTKWSGMATLDQAQFVGFDNFRALMTTDDKFRRALIVTAWYALLAVPTSQIAALIAAMLVNHEFKGVGFFRAAWYLPSVLAGVGVAVMWKWVFHNEYGLLKTVIDPLLPFGWKTPAMFEKDAAAWGVPAFAIVNLWSIGGTMMIYLAGLKGIPRELYEAGAIDGAVGWRRFIRVTLPMLSPVIFFNVIIAIIASFQVFTQAYIMTGGGPGDATRFYVVYLYNQAFDFHNMGYASAMAWLLLIIVLALTGLVMGGTRRFVYYEALK